MNEVEVQQAGGGAAYPNLLMTQVKSAAHIPPGPERDAALLNVLRACRQELEAAEAEAETAKLRCDEARGKFDEAARELAGCDFAAPDDSGGRGADRPRKRSKAASEHPGEGNNDGPMPIPTNPVHLPAVHTSAPAPAVVDGTRAMSEEMVAAHRESFYQRLIGISARDVESYTPEAGQVNLRSRAQLQEGVAIVTHWDTGMDGMDAKTFRAKHKSWYGKLKPPVAGSGRRAGVHVRTLESTHEPLLCLYSRDGHRSTPYVPVSLLYDALLEIHVMEHGHKMGVPTVKARAAELYANVSESTVRVFLETCPLCQYGAKRAAGGGRKAAEVTARV